MANDVVAEMGLDDPVGPIVPADDQRRRMAIAAAPLTTTAAVVGDWLDKALNWTPLVDLHERVVVPAYAVEQLILKGKVGALVAGGGTGKTTLKLHLAVCIATGRRFFDLAVARGTFVLFSSDDPQEDLEGALALVCRAMKLSEAEMMAVGLKVRVISLQGEAGIKTFASTAAGHVVATDLPQQIVDAVSQIPDLVGIGLDTLRQFSGGSSNDEQVVKLTISGATDIAQRTGAFVMISHHTGKTNYRDGIADMYAGSGSAAIADNCRFVLVLQTSTWADIEAKVRRTGQERGGPLVLTSARGSLLMKAPAPIFLHRDGFHIGRVAGAVLTRDQQLDERDREVLRAVRGGCETKNAIAARVKGKRGSVLQHIDDLESRGHIMNGSQGGSRKYVITDSGKLLLEQHP